MARIVKLSVELCPVRPYEAPLEFIVKEQVRTAKERTVCLLQCGDVVHAEDFGVLLQVIEDVLLAAVGRTVGVAERLAF